MQGQNSATSHIAFEEYGDISYVILLTLCFLTFSQDNPSFISLREILTEVRESTVQLQFIIVVVHNTFPINRDIQILRRVQLRERDFF